MRSWLVAIVIAMLGQVGLADEFIVLQSTTSTQNSGLFDAILPEFEKESGVEVRVVAVGTGQALRNGRNGDGDVLLVHAKTAEEAFVDEGFGVARRDVMYNDFVIVGPSADPAAVSGQMNVDAALMAIAETASKFASRADDSGTHKAELRLWSAAGLDPADQSGKWYIETGSGMGATLNIAAGIGAYVLTDRATWIAFENKRDLQLLFEGDERLFNQYGVIAVNPDLHSHVKFDAAQQFIDWLTGPAGQGAIESYQLSGQQLFFPNASAGDGL